MSERSWASTVIFHPYRLLPTLNASRRALFVSLSSASFFTALRSSWTLAPANLLGSLRAHAQTSILQRERTTLDITLIAAEDVNQDEKMRGAPILVRMYELRAGTGFETADYLSLHGNERAVLGTELLVRDEYVLRPGEKRQIRRKSHPDLETLGWLAGYKELAKSEWRTVVRVDLAPEVVWYRAPIPANKLKLVVNLQRQGIQVIHVD